MTEPMILTKPMIEQLFDGAAAAYNRTGPGIFTQFGARLVERMPLTPGAHVLDVATGTGAALIPAAQRVGPGGHVTGIDLSGAMLQEAARAAAAAGLVNVDLRKMDAEHLDFPDRTFTAVTCAFGIFLCPDMPAALAEMVRVCRPGGTLGVSVFGKTPPPFSPGWPILLRQFADYQVGIRLPQPAAYTPEEVEALLGRCGFGSIETQCETTDVIFPSAEEWWEFQLTLGARPTILGMDEPTRARFRDEYLARLRPLFRPDGLQLSVAVVYAIARR